MAKKFTFTGVLEKVEANITFPSRNGSNLIKSLITFDDSEEYNGKKYENKVTFELFGADRAKKAETLIVGHAYEVSFYLTSREYNGSIFNTLRALDVIDKTVVVQPKQPVQAAAPVPPPPTAVDDLPF